MENVNPEDFLEYIRTQFQTNPDFARKLSTIIPNPPTTTNDPAPADSDDDELERKPEKLTDCMLFTGRDLSEWHSWKFFIVNRIARTVHKPFRQGQKGLNVILDALRGSALVYYQAGHPFKSTDHFFEVFERDHKIQTMKESAMHKIDHLQWSGDLQLYSNEFMSLSVWCIGMDEYTMLNKFINPLPFAYRDFFATHRAGVNTWQEASTMLISWQQDRARFVSRSSSAPTNKTTLPGPSPASSSNSSSNSNSSSGPVPMDINAAQAGGSKQHPTPAAVFWADKTCNACGKKGHGASYRGCPKHPQYNPRPQSNKTYAAAASAFVGSHPSSVAPPFPSATPAAAPTAASSASTSAAAAGSDNAEMKAQMANITAMLQALVGNN
jgi:hypothetical protein